MLATVTVLSALVMAAPGSKAKSNLTASAVGPGRRLFHDPSIGKNGVSCAQCHSLVENEAAEGDGLLRAGHSLWGVSKRPHWRGDSRRTAYPRLGKAIDICVQLFQGGKRLDSLDNKRLVQFLSWGAPRRSQPPLQIQPALEANATYGRSKYQGGDIDRGRALFYRACNSCHPNGGKGLGPSLIGSTVAQVAGKVREGNGLLRGSREPGAWMPFFGRDRLTDQNVADIAAFVSTLTD